MCGNQLLSLSALVVATVLTCMVLHGAHVLPIQKFVFSSALCTVWVSQGVGVGAPWQIIGHMPHAIDELQPSHKPWRLKVVFENVVTVNRHRSGVLCGQVTVSLPRRQVENVD
jgi:hypothetical protein